MQYPIGNQTFSSIIENKQAYVDKTDLVYDLAQRHICVFSRPRRFGKSLTVSTLKSYFKGEKEWFRGLKMGHLEKDWKVYPVLHFDFATGYIFEFKLDGTAQEALDQIAAKGYAEPYTADPRKLFRIGVSFSSTQRTTSDWQIQA